MLKEEIANCRFCIDERDIKNFDSYSELQQRAVLAGKVKECICPDRPCRGCPYSLYPEGYDGGCEFYMYGPKGRPEDREERRERARVADIARLKREAKRRRKGF